MGGTGRESFKWWQVLLGTTILILATSGYGACNSIIQPSKQTDGRLGTEEGGGSSQDGGGGQKSEGLPALTVAFVWIIYIFVTVGCVVAIWVVADKYLVPVLESFISVWGLQEDVVGATFMAGGLSSHLLFINIMYHIFESRDDSGIGEILGYSNFNIFFVLGIVGLVSGKALALTCWPFCREGLFYIGTVILTVFCFSDSRILWWEATFLLLVYVGYLIAMTCNRRIQSAVGKSRVEIETGSPSQQEMTPMEDGATSGAGVSNSWPTDGNILSKLAFILLFPLNFLLRLTLPDLSTPRGRRFLVWGYIGSILWIAVFAMVMFWFASSLLRVQYFVTGSSGMLGLFLWPPTTATPHLIVCILMGRRGRGDMVLASAVAHVIFQFLIAFPLPWLIYSFVFAEPVRVSAKGALCLGVILLGIWLFLLLSVLIFRWRMTKGFGVLLLILYLVFLGVTVLFELEVLKCPTFGENSYQDQNFGNFNELSTIPPGLE